LLATFKFDEQPILVDLKGDMTPVAMERIMEKFRQHRSKKTGPPLYIATERDQSNFLTSFHLFLMTYADPCVIMNIASELWTKHTPDNDALNRLVAYARSSSNVLENLIGGGGVTSLPLWRTLFKTPLSSYDILIQLREDTLPLAERRQSLTRTLPDDVLHGSHPHRYITHDLPIDVDGTLKLDAATETKKDNKKKYKAPPSAADTRSIGNTLPEVPLVGLSPSRLFVAELSRHLASIATIGIDALGGSLIGITLKASAFEARPLAVAHCAFTRPIQVRNLLVCCLLYLISFIFEWIT
jgi:hypothetical protein